MQAGKLVTEFNVTDSKGRGCTGGGDCPLLHLQDLLPQLFYLIVEELRGCAPLVGPCFQFRRALDCFLAEVLQIFHSSYQLKICPVKFVLMITDPIQHLILRVRRRRNPPQKVESLYTPRRQRSGSGRLCGGT